MQIRPFDASVKQGGNPLKQHSGRDFHVLPMGELGTKPVAEGTPIQNAPWIINYVTHSSGGLTFDQVRGGVRSKSVGPLRVLAPLAATVQLSKNLWTI